MTLTAILPDWIEYDAASHTLTVYGVRYPEDMFVALSLVPPGYMVGVARRADGAVLLEMVQPSDPTKISAVIIDTYHRES
jgi:hypothetical protein